MELEEARDILANCIDDYVIAEYCSSCDDKENCKDDDCIFIKAIEVVLNQLDILKFKYQARKDRTDTIITKQEKMIELMVEKYNDDFGDIGDFCQHEYCSKDYNCKDCIKQYFEKKAEEK